MYYQQPEYHPQENPVNWKQFMKDNNVNPRKNLKEEIPEVNPKIMDDTHTHGRTPLRLRFALHSILFFIHAHHDCKLRRIVPSMIWGHV